MGVQGQNPHNTVHFFRQIQKEFLRTLTATTLLLHYTINCCRIMRAPFTTFSWVFNLLSYIIFDLRYFQVAMDVFIVEVPWRIGNATEYLVLEYLNDFGQIRFLCSSPKMDAITPYRFWNLLVSIWGKVPHVSSSHPYSYLDTLFRWHVKLFALCVSYFLLDEVDLNELRLMLFDVCLWLIGCLGQ